MIGSWGLDRFSVSKGGLSHPSHPDAVIMDKKAAIIPVRKITTGFIAHLHLHFAAYLVFYNTFTFNRNFDTPPNARVSDIK